MLPIDINIFSKTVSHAIRQRKCHDPFGVIFLEADISFASEGNSHGEILSFGHRWFDGSGVVMEGLPLGAVAEPVETSGFDVHAEVVADPVDHQGEGGALFFPVFAVVIGYEVRVVVPEFPEFLFVDSRSFDFFEKFGIDVGNIAEDVWHQDDVTSCQLQVAFLEASRDNHSHVSRLM